MPWKLVLLSALAVSVGWGFNGNYGHEAGAMLPGALAGLAICLASGREDWLRRATPCAFFGAMGFAIGGQISYGIVIGYTAHISYPDVAYGYASLFVIGALWTGTGTGILSLALTKPRSELERFTGPLVALWAAWFVLDMSGATSWLHEWSANVRLHAGWPTLKDYDVDWVAASSAFVVSGVYAALVPRARRAALSILLLAAGWIAGFAILTFLFGLRMTPPRSDNWAGCVGLFIALAFYLIATRNRAGLMLALYGLLAGGIGFSGGDFLKVLAHAEWGPIGRWEALDKLDYWKWMEQSFGLMVGIGVGLAAVRLLRGGLTPPEEDRQPGWLRLAALLFLFVVMMWDNFALNAEDWGKTGVLREELFGLSLGWWFVSAAVLPTAAVVVAMVRHHRGSLTMAPSSPLGRAQWLFLLLLWICLGADLARSLPQWTEKSVFFVQITFWLTAGLCSLLVVTIQEHSVTLSPEIGAPPDDLRWMPGWRHWSLWAAVPALILLVAWLSVRSHQEKGPLPGSHLRFTDMHVDPNP